MFDLACETITVDTHKIVCNGLRGVAKTQRSAHAIEPRKKVLPLSKTRELENAKQ